MRIYLNNSKFFNTISSLRVELLMPLNIRFINKNYYEKSIINKTSLTFGIGLVAIAVKPIKL